VSGDLQGEGLGGARLGTWLHSASGAHDRPAEPQVQ
jgi:hypothetical protein